MEIVMTVGSRNLAIALRAKLNAGRPALALAAHKPLAAKPAADGASMRYGGSGFEPSDSYAVLDAIRAVAG